MHTSSCRRWLTKYRPNLFNSVEYVQPPDTMMTLNNNTVWPFIDSNSIAKAFSQMVSDNKPLSSVTYGRAQSAKYSLAYKKVAQYMLGVSEQPPPTIGRTTTPNCGYLRFLNAAHRDMALLMLAGRWGYLWWTIYSDEFHVTGGIVGGFPGDVARLSGESLTDNAIMHRRPPTT